MFAAGSGNDWINDFSASADMLQFQGFEADDLAVSQSGQNTWIDYGAERVIMRNVDMDVLVSDNFLFVRPNGLEILCKQRVSG